MAARPPACAAAASSSALALAFAAAAADCFLVLAALGAGAPVDDSESRPRLRERVLRALHRPSNNRRLSIQARHVSAEIKSERIAYGALLRTDGASLAGALEATTRAVLLLSSLMWVTAAAPIDLIWPCTRNQR